MWSRLDALRAVRNSHGDGATPLWVTEMGIETETTGGVPLGQQGDELIGLYRSVEGHDIRSFVVHRLYDIGSQSFGVLHEDLTPKPAYGELGAAIGAASPSSAASPTPGVAGASQPSCRAKAAAIAGSDRTEVIKGTPGDDVIAGLDGKDVVRGLGGNDLICGGKGRDRLIGGPGNDTLLGQAGADTFKGGAGKDVQKQ
jgi:Ca2+-binding RTX toxin-like protein